ncbi:MAG TPA: TetR/AcrR family transcriptional regulator [Solirubrobacterales bacterium]|jgi:AcrR family transcriptional regulator|nr:TetR/AcrR family transcriptional regulator [Solirubrobacterales bacterium]
MPSTTRKSKRGEILLCFTELVAERGYDEVSVRDIAEALEISKGTVLHHFRSKEAILEQINNDYMRRRLAEARDYLPELDDPVDELQAFICHLMLCQQDDRAATVAFSREIRRSAEEPTMAEVRRLRDEFSAILIEILERGVKSGAFAAVDPRLTAVQIFGMVNWAWTWFRPDGPMGAAEIADQFSRTLIGGLAPGSTRDGAAAERLTAAVATAMRAHPVADD